MRVAAWIGTVVFMSITMIPIAHDEAYWAALSGFMTGGWMACLVAVEAAVRR